jgi:hypothetical protein
MFALNGLHVLTNILDKKALTNTVYIDIKSEWLRDVLRMVLKGVHGISTKEDKPSVSSPSEYAKPTTNLSLGRAKSLVSPPP